MRVFEARQRCGVTAGGRRFASTVAAGLTGLLAVGLACDGRPLSGSAGGAGGAGAQAAGGRDPGVSRGTGGNGHVGAGGAGGNGGPGGSTTATGGTAAGGATAGSGGAGGAGAADGTGGARPATPTDVDSLSRACVPGTINPGPSPLRRLTSYEYDNTVRDLVGLSESPSTGSPFSMTFPSEVIGAYGFSNVADYQSVSDALAEAYLRAAEEIAVAAVAQLGMLAPSCDSAKMGAMACATSFIGAFGKKAFRRPLTTDEIASYQDLFVDGSADGTFEAGIAEVIAAMLQSPHFLYRVELTQPAPGAKVVPVAPYELATRLSYFVWASMPDETLFAAADANQLATSAALEAQVKRMVSDSRAEDMTRRFHREWLSLDNVLSVSKSPTAFPSWNSALAADLLTESETFADRVFWDDGSLAALLTAPYSYLNGNLANYYGYAAPADPTTFVRVSVDRTQRAGILTQGAFLAGQAFGSRISASQLGTFLRGAVLCRPVPIEPPGLETPEPEPAPAGATSRQLLEMATAGPTCRPCHALFDPLGFGFGNFDAVGRWQATENGSVIDASGEIVDVIDPATRGPFNGPVELMKKLATSGDVRACVADKWFRWSSGRVETLPDDACSLLTINKRFQNANYDMRALLPAIVSTDAFRYRSAGGTP